MFLLLLRIRQKSEVSQNSTLEWPNVDLKVWDESFGGVFLLKSGLGFFVGATETPFSVYPRLPKCMHLSKKHYAKNQVSIVGTKNPKPLFNRNTHPKLTFHTFRSTLDRSKVLFWLPSDFCQIRSNNENTEMPSQQNMFNQKVTPMVLIVLDL